MQNEIRDKLVMLIDTADEECKHSKSCKSCSGYGKGSLCMTYHFADHLLANGVIVPPCKVGAIVYLFYPVRKGIYEAVVDEICLSQKSKFIVVRDLYFNRRQSIFFEQIGKTVFLTKEEAEKALKERENNGC